MALGYYLCGKASAVVGTHTHVQTADEKVLLKGTGYITDVGMTGPVNSVLGIKSDIIIDKLRNKLPVRFEIDESPYRLDAVIFDIDNNSGKTTAVERLSIS